MSTRDVREKSRLMDQAQTLRLMHSRSQAASGITRVISVTSGKGGAGKTNTVVNLALALGRLGRRVLIFDADMGLANVDVLLGLKIENTLHDVFTGRKSLEEIIVEGPEGVSIIPSASGIAAVSELTPDQQLMLLEAVEQVASQFDYLLIDTRAGIGADVMYFNSASSEVLCVINPEPTSLTDAYALIKILSRDYGEKTISVLVNNAASEKEAILSFRRLERSSQRFLHIELRYLGFIPADGSVREAVQEQRALMQLYPSSPAAMATSALARRLDTDFHVLKVKGGMQFFFRQLLEAGVNGS